MTHSFRGKRYRIQLKKPSRNDMGSCDPPEKMDRTILIDPAIRGMPLMGLLIHEALHACYFDLAEEPVNDAAQDIARLLYRFGFRQPTQP